MKIKLSNILAIILIFSLIGTGIYVMEKTEEINRIRHQNPYIEFFYYCPDVFVSQYYNCEKGLAYENLTGNYCNGTLVCENDYNILSNWDGWYWGDWEMEKWTWVHEWDKKRSIKVNNESEPSYFIYYSESIGKFKGILNLFDEDERGDCWSYNGSDEKSDWRIYGIEENMLRRCNK